MQGAVQGTYNRLDLLLITEGDHIQYIEQLEA